MKGFFVLLLIPGIIAEPLRFLPREAEENELLDAEAPVMCPNREQYCRKHQTCCECEPGRYKCCPMRDAVCCSDREHCCPKGYECDEKHWRCSKGDHYEPFLRGQDAVNSTDYSKVSLQAKLRRIITENGPIRCKDGVSCPSGSTCCKLTSGKFGCCPLPSATCCKDGVHCCPNTYVCDEQKAQCRKGLVTMPWYTKLPSTELPPIDIICPDLSTTCPRSSTCCKTKDLGYACCPLPNAVCCNDGIHCCKFGYTCDLKRGMCVQGHEEQPLYVKFAAKAIAPSKTSPAKTLGFILCPDYRTQCPALTTCCLLTSGDYGCCPLPKAVCCEDRLHCCAEGYTCNVAQQSCDKQYESIPMVKKMAGIKRNKCGDDNDLECPDDMTCCRMSNGEMGCCPTPEATCCHDEGNHCCPHGMICDVERGRCHNVDVVVPILKKIQATKSLTARSITCPDHESQCKDGQSCCMTVKGSYACCPHPKANCCEDGVHCCPDGYQCDLKAGRCTKQSTSLDAMLPLAGKLPTLKVSTVICPDQRSECPDGSTCCTLASGQYGCCPIPKAVCCSDHVHCCPNGYTCDVSAGTCNQGLEKIPLYKKSEAKNTQVALLQSIVCPDGRSQCPEGNTCCTLASGQYGCCPIPKAVCCSDHVHCCPNGYTCDVSAGTCNQGLIKIPMYKKAEAKNTQVALLQSIVCPDGQAQCPEGSTCCKLASGQYGCCPIPKAVCCSDHVHCCPNGYTCDVSAGTCNQGLTKIPLYKKAEAKNTQVAHLQSIVCPDGRSQCPEGNTCCTLASGQYGCCPIPKAVCCSDHVHCCPNGYTCDVSAGTCNQGLTKIPIYKKAEAKEAKLARVLSVRCPDGQSQCPDGNTCCKLASGQYGCCPLPKAVCCSDKVHCCPNGYTCGSGGVCTRGDEVIPGYLKTEASSRVSRPVVRDLVGAPLHSIVCPDGQAQCPEGNTCCKLASGQYGCCPMPKAVCCSDHVHCCPNGYTCDVSAGTCNQGLARIPLYKKAEAKNTQVATLQSIVCPDGRSQCPEGNTCCKLASGQYGCCPIPKAVCCSDHVHCCPNGYTCDVSAGTCNQGLMTIPMYKKKETRTTSLKTTVCPDKKSSCPEETTCCMMSDGFYGCCPMPNAVCCADKLHCCPEGSKCDVTKGTCQKSGLTFRWQRKVSGKKVEKTPCPGGGYCPDTDTCCSISAGAYGCCPYTNATCCPDKKHCCPHGTICVNKGAELKCQPTPAGLVSKFILQTKARPSEPRFIRPPIFMPNLPRPFLPVPQVEKKPSPVKVEKNVCPDRISWCNDWETCCDVGGGQYGCCPYKKGVCCKDHVHCCPNGYKCSNSQCLKGLRSFPLTEPRAARRLETPEMREPAVRDIDCGENVVCPEGTTCCDLFTGEPGCCPVPNAKCCSDKKHCCGEGFVCDESGTKCVSEDGALVIASLEKIPAHNKPHSGE